MNVLHILAHPDFANEKRTVNQLAQTAIAQFAGVEGANVEVVNLYDPDLRLPRISAESLTVFDPELMSEERKLDVVAQKAFLAQWKAADLIYIYAPIHNFCVPSKLKDYLDNVLIISETFGITEKGYVGLMSDKTKVTAVLTSGSDFNTDFRYQAIDVAPQFLRAALHIVGIHHMSLIRAQGLDIIGNDRQAIVAQTKAELTSHIQNQIAAFRAQ